MCSAVVDKTTGTPLPTRKSVRQLRWFESSFRARMAAISARTGVQYTLSDMQLVDTFLAWHRAFDRQKPASRMVRRAYVSFAAGMMFHELLRKRPVSVRSGAGQGDSGNPALTRPEAYLYASYCHVIRQAILDQDFWRDTRKPDRLDDPAIWREFSDDMAQDVEAAIAFLDLFAGEKRRWNIPAPMDAGKGFGNRFWALTALQAEGDGAEDTTARHARSGLRLVSDRTNRGRTAIPAATRLVLVAFEGVVARTDSVDSAVLSALLGEYNVWLTPHEASDRFAGQPLSSAMTYLAEQTGQICPGGFMARLEQRLIERDKRALEPMPGICRFLERLRRSGRDVAIVSHGRPRRIEAAWSLPAFSALRSAGRVHMLDPQGETHTGLQTVAAALGHVPAGSLLIDAGPIGIGMARRASMPTIGFAAPDRTADRTALSCAGAQGVVTDLAALTV